MAITYKPHIWSGAYNPIVWVATGGLVALEDPKYLIDIYINGATGATYQLKQNPNPAGAMVLDVGPIVQSYIELTNYAAEQDTPTQFKDSADIVADVWIDINMEAWYNAFNVYLTDYVGAGYSQEGGTGPVRVLPAALDYYDSIDHMETSTTNGYFADYIMDGDGKFLKMDSNNINLNINDHHTLSFLNTWDGAAGTYQESVQGIQIKYYDSSGTLLSGSQFFQNITGNGGGPQTSDSYVSTIETRDTKMITFRCGPKDLTVPNNTSYYTAQAYMKASATTSSSPGTVASELVKFNIVDEDCAAVHDKVRLSFLNDLGGRDYYNFTKFYEKTTNSKQKKYSQPSLDWSNWLEPIATTSDKTGNWLRGGNKIFNKTITTQIKMQSDWLSQEQVDFLGNIPESSSVWAYIGDVERPYTVSVDNLVYSYKTVKQEKLVLVTIEATLTKINIKQTI